MLPVITAHNQHSLSHLLTHTHIKLHIHTPACTHVCTQNSCFPFCLKKKKLHQLGQRKKTKITFLCTVVQSVRRSDDSGLSAERDRPVSKFPIWTQFPHPDKFATEPGGETDESLIGASSKKKRAEFRQWVSSYWSLCNTQWVCRSGLGCSGQNKELSFWSFLVLRIPHASFRVVVVKEVP